MDAFTQILVYSTLAGLATGVGGILAAIIRPGKKSFGFLMGFAAGVMLSLSFFELIPEAWKMSGYLPATLGFLGGALFMGIADSIIPHIYRAERENVSKNRLFATGMLVALGIAIHNIPEGMVIGAGYAHTPAFGLFIAIAIALHNIPEGLAITLPLCKGGMCKWKAARTALLAGFAEPFGAIIAYFFLSSFAFLIPLALAFAAGVMVFLSIDELMPIARDEGHQNFSAIGVIVGAAFVLFLSGLFGI